MISGNNGEIYASTGCDAGSFNDKTIVKTDRAVERVRNDPNYTNYEWKAYDATGTLQRHKGAYLLCDGGTSLANASSSALTPPLNDESIRYTFPRFLHC